MQNAENRLPNRTSAFIYAGAAHFCTQKMGKLQARPPAPASGAPPNSQA